MASILDLFNNKNAQDAADAQKAGIATGQAQGGADLGQGLNLATTSYTAGLQPFQQNYATDQAGQNAYADATGANGAAGNARAVQNFQTGPGYQFQLDQGTQNVMRNKAATGQLASGATDADLQTLGQGQANQAWQQYLTNLQPFLGQSTANAGGIGSLYSGLGNLQNQNLGQKASLDYGASTSAGNAQANADLANNAAAANQFGALKGAVSTGAQLLAMI
jgi:hypothetical protein